MHVASIRLRLHWMMMMMMMRSQKKKALFLDLRGNFHQVIKSGMFCNELDLQVSHPVKPVILLH